VAAVIAGAMDSENRPLYFVIGVDLQTEAGISKINAINAGLSPMDAPDPQLSDLIRRAVHENRNLCGTFRDEVYALADVVIINISLDVKDRTESRPEKIEVDTESYKASMTKIGRLLNPDALVLVETTVPVGTSEHFILPILREEFKKRGFDREPQLAYAYERVMPGPRYVDSIRRFWRTFAGSDAASALKAREFLSTFIETNDFPLHELESLEACELAKLLENSYRSVNIALIYEWTLMAERLGIDLFSVINSIRVRTGTHCNMRFPGFGVGGYCLTKDSLLAQWSLTHLSSSDIVLGMTLSAIQINYRMPLHTLELSAELMNGSLEGKRVVVCGVSYLPGVPDTRNSPSELLYDELVKAGAKVVMHDPVVSDWSERPHVQVCSNLEDCLPDADLIIFTTAHEDYVGLPSEELINYVGRPSLIVDAQNVIPDHKAAELRHMGCSLIGVGKGHWRARAYHQRIQTCGKF
jgi:nucleotide sugar dehydrogenase